MILEKDVRTIATGGRIDVQMTHLSGDGPGAKETGVQAAVEQINLAAAGTAPKAAAQAGAPQRRIVCLAYCCSLCSI
jgi:hypothetical protein